MDQILTDIPITEYINDDMIITGTDDEGHLHNVESVLKWLKEYNLKNSLDKWKFFMDRIAYCRHETSVLSLQKTPKKRTGHSRSTMALQ